MDLAQLDYELPPALIAQQPAARRDDSRLLVYDRARRDVRHRRFAELPDELGSDHLVVVNDTRVVPARIPIATPRGEVLLLERLEEHVIHGERYAVDAEAWQRIEHAEHVLAVGTTTVRVLETLARGAPLE